MWQYGDSKLEGWVYDTSLQVVSLERIKGTVSVISSDPSCPNPDGSFMIYFLINNLEDIVVFLESKVFNSKFQRFHFFAFHKNAYTSSKSLKLYFNQAFDYTKPFLKTIGRV